MNIGCEENIDDDTVELLGSNESFTNDSRLRDHSPGFEDADIVNTCSDISPSLFIHQKGNHCMLISILNCLRYPEIMKKFLRTDDVRDWSYYINYMLTNRVGHMKNVKTKEGEEFPNGVTSCDIRSYIDHLKNIGVISDYIFHDVTNKVNVGYFLTPHTNKANETYLLIGYNVSVEDRNKLFNKFRIITDNETGDRLNHLPSTKSRVDQNGIRRRRKTERKVTKQYHFSLYHKLSKQMMKLLSASRYVANPEPGESHIVQKTKFEIRVDKALFKVNVKSCPNLHASAVVFDSNGFASICEPSRHKPHLLRPLRDDPTCSALEDIVHSAAVLYKIYRIQLNFV